MLNVLSKYTFVQVSAPFGLTFAAASPLNGRHFAEHADLLLSLATFLFRSFRMANSLHCFLTSVIKKRRTASSCCR